MVDLIWATRGHRWGFRILLDGGHSNPISAYERAFAGFEQESSFCRRSDRQLALRFPDPRDRTDAARRVIPHDFVIGGSLTTLVDSVEDGISVIWPLVAATYADVWNSWPPPSISSIRSAIDSGP